MSKELEELKRLAYENACCRCQYYIDNKCNNKGECVWLNIETALKDYEKVKNKYGVLETEYCDQLNIATNKEVCSNTMKKNKRNSKH